SGRTSRKTRAQPSSRLCMATDKGDCQEIAEAAVASNHFSEVSCCWPPHEAFKMMTSASTKSSLPPGSSPSMTFDSNLFMSTGADIPRPKLIFWLFRCGGSIMKTELLKTVRRHPGEFYIGQGRGAWVHIWSKPREIIREARKSLKKRQRHVRKYRAPRRA